MPIVLTAVISSVGSTRCQKRPTKWGQLTTWKHWITRFFHQWIFLLWHGCFPRWLYLWQWFGNNETLWIGHHRTQTLNPLRIFGKCCKRFYTQVVTLHNLSKWCLQSKKAKGGPSKFYSVWLFFQRPLFQFSSHYFWVCLNNLAFISKNDQ